MKKITYYFLVATFLLSSSIAMSQESAAPSVYASIGGSNLYDNFDLNNTTLDFDQSSGVNAKIGYIIDSIQEVEVDVLIINGFDEKTSSITIDGYMVTMNSKWYSRQESLSMYALLGIGIGSLEASSAILGTSTGSFTGGILKIGGGLELAIASNISFYAEATYNATSGDIEGVDFIPVTVGAKFLF